MKTFPIKQAIAIVILIIAIVCTVQFLPESKIYQQPEGGSQTGSNSAELYTITDSPEFRFSSKPKFITLKDFDDNVILHQTEFSEVHKYIELDDITIAYDKNKISRLQLIVEWDSAPTPYHFFDMQFSGYQGAKFATSSTSNIYEDIQLQW